MRFNGTRLSDVGSIDRTTFIVTKDGKVKAILGSLKPAENVEKSLEAIQQLAASNQTK